MERQCKEKLKAVGIVAEYNPFHNGHKYHLEKSLELSRADISVAVISGNFTQRGDFALMNKWQRSEMAVRCGLNLVVEMPTVFGCGNAGYFARSGIDILENLGVDYISFGSESGNIERLKEISRAITENQEIIEENVKVQVKDGISYPRARQEALTGIIGDDKLEVIQSPNNVLALEYLKHIKTAVPITVERIGAGYNDEAAEGTFPSATSLRHSIYAGRDVDKYLPEAAGNVVHENISHVPKDEVLFKMIAQTVFSRTEEELATYFGAEEGLGNKIKNTIRYCNSTEVLLEKLKSKRYTLTRLKRTLLMILLGVSRSQINNTDNYMRVLAMDDKGKDFLGAAKKSGICNIPIITNMNKEFNAYPTLGTSLETDILADDLYNLATGRNLYEWSDYVKKPLIL